ncbi:8220_t:CDS:2, partial [Entrophospora sp. SA101]
YSPTTENFRDYYMSQLTNGFGEDLDKIRKEQNLDSNRLEKPMNMEKKLFQEQQTIASAGFKIIETNEDAITETEGVIGYAAQKDKEVATHPI